MNFSAVSLSSVQVTADSIHGEEVLDIILVSDFDAKLYPPRYLPYRNAMRLQVPPFVASVETITL